MITMAQMQKQKVRLTDLLRDTIKDLRKTYNKRGDVLSKELDRGASYVSQLENGKIKDIEFDLLDTMFQRIIGLSGDYYNDYIQKYIYDIIQNTTSREILYNEEWIHIFVMQVFQIEISDTIIEVIEKKLKQLDYTAEQLVKEINKNKFQRQWLDVKREENKMYITVGSYSYDNYWMFTDIIYSLQNDYVEKILSKEITTSNYIIMEGILSNLYIIESDVKGAAMKRAQKILFDNNFFNTIEIFETLHELSHPQQPLNVEVKEDEDVFTFYDDIIVNYNEKYKQLKEQAVDKLGYAFDRYRDEHSSYACETLEKILKNMDGDLGLMVAILSSSLNTIPRDMKHYFWDDFKALIERYSQYKQ